VALNYGSSRDKIIILRTYLSSNGQNLLPTNLLKNDEYFYKQTQYA